MNIKQLLKKYNRTYNINSLLGNNYYSDILELLRCDLEFFIDKSESISLRSNAIFIYSKSFDRLIGEYNTSGKRFWFENSYIDNIIRTDKNSFHNSFIIAKQIFTLLQCDNENVQHIELEERVYDYCSDNSYYLTKLKL